jgi:hypothetical protein
MLLRDTIEHESAFAPLLLCAFALRIISSQCPSNCLNRNKFDAKEQRLAEEQQATIGKHSLRFSAPLRQKKGFSNSVHAFAAHNRT